MTATRSRHVSLLISLVLVLAACSPSPVPGGTPTGAAPVATTVAAPTIPVPTAAPTQVATAVPTAAPTTTTVTAVPTGTVTGTVPAAPRFAFQAPDQRVLLADAESQTSELTMAELAFDTPQVFPAGRATSTTLYLLHASGPGGPQGAYAVDARGVRALDFITSTGYMLTVWPGDAKNKPRLAWNVADGAGSSLHSAIYVANADGTDVRPLLERDSDDGHVLLPLRWSRDGNRLYYSNEPTGFGGYILFPGVSSLSVYDLTKNTSTTLIAEGSLGQNHFLCITDISPDETMAAYTCGDEHAVSLVPLTGGEMITIDSPADVAAMTGQRGSARFGPDSARLAYAAARGVPDTEQGWALVDEGLRGISRLIATSEPDVYYTVKGWLDNNTIVLQVESDTPSVWLAYLDGTELTKVGDGLFLAIMP